MQTPLIKNCIHCGTLLTSETAVPSIVNGLRKSYICRKCANEAARKRYSETKEQRRIYNRKKWQKDHLIKNVETAVSCPICGEKFRNWRGISAHVFQRHKGHKFCSICHIELTVANTGKYYIHANFCQNCRRKYHRERGERLYKDPVEREKFHVRQDKHTDNQRQILLDLLGNHCVICGFNNPLALQIDHVNNNGAEERAKYRTTKNGKNQCSLKYYRVIREKLKQGSKEYQLLCANCNAIKRRTLEIEHRNLRKLQVDDARNLAHPNKQKYSEN
jgi:hypothetical protein